MESIRLRCPTLNIALAQRSQADRPQLELSVDTKSTCCKQPEIHRRSSWKSLAEDANVSLKNANTAAIDAPRAGVAGISYHGSFASRSTVPASSILVSPRACLLTTARVTVLNAGHRLVAAQISSM
ncbi:hypothetical protein MRX96_023455 [Rhipicephalus microplus]